jgi:hypothetical protein
MDKVDPDPAGTGNRDRDQKRLVHRARRVDPDPVGSGSNNFGYDEL